MIKAKLVAVSSAILIASIYPQEIAADEFTAGVVAGWSEEAQNALIQNSIVMTGIVASRHRRDISQCLDKWYAPDLIAERQQYVRQLMVDFPDYHPQAIILGAIEKACGSFSKN